MKNMLKKTLALVLALCSLLALCLPAAPAASAAAYSFEKFGKVTELGVVLRGNPNISGLLDIAEKNGRQYLGVPIKGGEFYVFALTDYLEKKPNAAGNYIYAKAESGIGVPRGIALDSKGNFYAVGDSASVFWYNINTGRSGHISTGASGLSSVAVDANDNVYAAGKSGGGAAVFRIDGNTLTSQGIYTSSDHISFGSVVCGGGKVYVQGALRDSAGKGSEIKMLSSSGAVLSSYHLPATDGSYYLSYVDGVVFLGVHSGATEDGFVALDTAGNTLTRMDLGNRNTIQGMVTNPYEGKSYMCLDKDGTYEYDVATRTLGQKVSNTCNRPLRARNYVRSGSSMLLLSAGPSSVTTIKGPSSNTVSLTGLLEGSGSTFTPRSMAPGVPGTGVAVYVGAYLSAGVGSYSPATENPITNSAFSNGYAQTDSMITYNGKLYAGCYSGAHLVEYDPVTGDTRELIPGLKDEYGQLRIHGLAAGDNKIFFSTIPNDQTLGGAIGWYDLARDTWYCHRNVVSDQSVIALAYDEEANILFGGTTIRGGTNSTPTASQAVLFAYDTKEKRVLDQVTVGNLTGDRPKMISGIAQDPSTGKFWGLVSQTVFSFTCENGKLTVTEEWEAATVPSDPYPDGGSLSWFPKAILFDGKGGMYMGLNEDKYGIMKFTIGDNGKIQKTQTLVKNTTRIYTLGADGNMYYYGDQLYQISLDNRVATVRILIDNAVDAQGIADARQAYDSLTQEEKEQLGNVYYQKLVNLENGDDSLIGQTVNAISAIGNVNADSGSAIQNARQLFDGLTASQKKQVSNVKTLFDAEKAYWALTVPDETAPEDPVKTVTALIDEIGAVTTDSGPAIQKARVAYDDLTDKQKLEVLNAQVLFDAEQDYVDLLSGGSGSDKKDDADADLTAAILVKTQIDAIGTVTAASGPMIQSARQAYDALTPAQQAQVSNIDVLLAAEQAYADLDADDGSGAWIIILVVVLVLAAGAAAAVLILRKKKLSVGSDTLDAPSETPAEEIAEK